MPEEWAGNEKARKEAGGKTRPRERIVSAACALFRENGIRATGADAIAEAADTNKMTLYRHFGSKDELVCESLKAISAKAAEFWAGLEQAFPDDPKARLDRWVEHRAEKLLHDPCGCDLTNAAVELKEPDHPAYPVIERYKAEQRRRLVELCGAAGSREPELLADILTLLIEGARVSRRSAGPEGPSRSFSRACHAAILSLR